MLRIFLNKQLRVTESVCVLCQDAPCHRPLSVSCGARGYSSDRSDGRFKNITNSLKKPLSKLHNMDKQRYF